MTTKFDELVAKLKEIFQIDKPELDFGIYKIVNAACTQYCGEGDERHDQHAKLPRLDEKPAMYQSGLSAYYGMFPFVFMLVYYQTCTSL